MSRPTTPINLTSAQNEYLQSIVRSREVPHSRVLRAQIILKAAAGVSQQKNQSRFRIMPRYRPALETTLDRRLYRFIKKRQSEKIISSDSRTFE